MAPDRFVRIREAIQITGLKRSTIFKLIRNGDFPKQRQLTDRATGWLLSEIMAWVEARPVAGIERE
jgi:prophage regulatory protein